MRASLRFVALLLALALPVGPAAAQEVSSQPRSEIVPEPPAPEPVPLAPCLDWCDDQGNACVGSCADEGTSCQEGCGEDAVCQAECLDEQSECQSDCRCARASCESGCARGGEPSFVCTGG